MLRKQTVASLPDVLVALGPRVSRRTAFRKLKDLDARTSYSHRGGYYTLDELADFDERGLWSFAGVSFSRAGTLVATAEAFVLAGDVRCIDAARKRSRSLLMAALSRSSPTQMLSAPFPYA